MKCRNILLLLTALPLVFSGCIRDDVSKDCPPGKYICFVSVMDKYDHRDIVDDTELHLYDEEGVLVNSYKYSKAQLASAGYMALLPMQEIGTYDIVAVMCSGEDYLSANGPNAEDFYVTLKTDESGICKKEHRDIHHALGEVTFTPETYSNQEYETLYLYKNTNRINLSINFDGYVLPENSTLETVVTANNLSYDYRNICSSDTYVTYHPYRSIPPSEGDRLEHRFFKTMHVREAIDMMMAIREKDSQGNIVLEADLDIIQKLKKIYPTDKELDQEDEFDMEMTINAEFVIAELRINGWDIIKQGEEL